MSKKIPTQVVVDEILNNDLWEMNLEEQILADLSHEINDGMNCTWNWYMSVDRYKLQGWTHLVISSDHKNKTVANWLTDLGAEFKYEGPEFLINDSEIATMVALRWA
jgi:hypothetical protein